MPSIPSMASGAFAMRRDGLDSALITLAFNKQQALTCTYASLTWLIYDWIATLEDEVRLIWRSPNTTPKFLYLFSRYFGLLSHILLSIEKVSLFYCLPRLVLANIAEHLLSWCVEFGLMIRVYALWGRDIRVAMTLLIGFAIAEAANVALIVEGDGVMVANMVPYPRSWPIKGCAVLYSPRYYHSAWMPILSFETLLFFVSCVKCLSYRPFSEAPTVAKVFKDGAVYYLCVLLFISLDTALGYSNPDIMSYFDSFAIPFLSYAGSHMLLSIRSHFSDQDMIGPTKSESTACFGSGETTTEDHELCARPRRNNTTFLHPTIDETSRDTGGQTIDTTELEQASRSTKDDIL